jgi:cell wall-associated NlpC family hydrolase
MRPLVTLGSGSIVDVAIDQLGKPYRYGATGPNAFDCSGLVYYVLNRAGIHVPRLTSDGYYRLFAKTTRAALVPGDLAVYPDHIAIYVGGGNIIAATTPRGGVKRQSIDAPGRPFGFVHPA